MDYSDKVLFSQRELAKIEESRSTIIVKAKRGPSKKTTIPLKLTEEIAFLSGAIIGDGHLKKDKLQITLECTNEEIVLYLQKICKSSFGRDFNYHHRKSRLNKRESTELCIDSKAIYNLLKEVFEIPSGKKSHIVKVPSCILDNGKNSMKAAFLIGIMVTEGGCRRRGFGLSSASEKLRDGIVTLLKDLKIKTLVDSWTNKKYGKEYYGLVYKKELLNQIQEICENEEVRNIISKCPNLSI